MSQDTVLNKQEEKVEALVYIISKERLQKETVEVGLRNDGKNSFYQFILNKLKECNVQLLVNQVKMRGAYGSTFVVLYGYEEIMNRLKRELQKNKKIQLIEYSNNSMQVLCVANRHYVTILNLFINLNIKAECLIS